MSAIVLEKEYLPGKHKVKRLAVHEVKNQRLWINQLAELQMHHLRREIFSIFQSLGVGHLSRYNLFYISISQLFWKSTCFNSVIKIRLKKSRKSLGIIVDNFDWYIITLSSF